MLYKKWGELAMAEKEVILTAVTDPGQLELLEHVHNLLGK